MSATPTPETPETPPTPRVGGRVLVLDPQDRLLLIHERTDGGGTHWLTPGGGVEDDEDPATAAVREVHEEVGLQVRLVDPEAVLVTRRRWSWAGVTYDQTDHFFVARVPADPPLRPAGLTAVEQQTVIGPAWWTPEELRHNTERLVPPDLADVVDRLRSAG